MNLSIPPPWQNWLVNDESLNDLIQSEEFAQYYEDYFYFCIQKEKTDQYLPVILGADRSIEKVIEAIYDLIDANYDPVTKFEMMMSLDEFCEKSDYDSYELEAALDAMRGEMILLMVAALNEHYNRE